MNFHKLTFEVREHECSSNPKISVSVCVFFPTHLIDPLQISSLPFETEIRTKRRQAKERQKKMNRNDLREVTEEASTVWLHPKVS